jgi:hypothetical protein
MEENEKFQLNTNQLPTEKKPIFTIQDSYMQFYLGSAIDRKIAKESNKSSHIDLNSLMKNFINGETKIVQKEIDLIETPSEKKHKLSGKKHHRDKTELDPLDVGTIRGYKGNFISLNRALEKREHLLKMNQMKKIDDSKNEIQNEVYIEQNIIKEEKIPTYGVILKSSVMYGKGIPQITKPNIKEEIELIPTSIRNKLKK